MKRFYSSHILSPDVIDAAVRAGATAVDGDRDSLSGVKSLQFDEKTVIFSIANIHSEYSNIRQILLKHFLVFQTSKELFVPLSKNYIQDDKLQVFLQKSLAGIRLHLDVGVDQQPAAHGQWLIPANGEMPKSHPFDFLDVIAAREIGLIEEMYGFSTLGNFEFSLDKVRRRKKDNVEEVAPALWIDKILQDPQTGHISTRINILSRTGMKWRVTSQVIANGTMQDTNKLTEWVVSMVPCVVDRKGLGELVKELLRHAFDTIDSQIWIRSEGWIRSIDSNIEGCVCSQELLLAPGADAQQFYVDIAAPRLAQSGTLERWNQEVLVPVSKSHILTGALQIGLAATMLDLVPGVSSCTFNFFGGAGRGKTLLLSTVASLFGNTTAPGHGSAGRNGRSIIETFASTELALQAKGQATSLGPMLIDEIGSNNYGALDKFIYVTGNGNSRTRLSSNGDVQESPPKALFSMTTGEVPIGLLLSRNAQQGVLDRGVDINIGSGRIGFNGQVAEEHAFLSEGVKKAVSAAIPHQYGTVAPAYIKAILSEMDGQNWKAELDEIRQQLVDACPGYVSNDGPVRVLTRFALAVLAGRIALRNKVFSEDFVDEITLFNGVAACAERWINTRWHYLERLSAALIEQKRIPESAPRFGLPLYRHHEDSGDMPTLMITKEFLQKVFAGAEEVEVIGKRFKDDGLLVRADAGRNTVGKTPHYHLRTEWVKDHGIEWSEDLERFVEVASDDD
ncbi:DUF927 domain-containing protein [Pseudomonas sp. p50]|uniref:DUF927 domain-containing protein n=1 Tax=Pseudomonas sp. p50(2008) TaxID=2816832 RepID=UPI00188D53F5|nr:DUF927 domain-containing protein [Pseudomonas sp. p50(2008)]MBF4557154.1 DUF927 domain-containing protein [Pseudomonas sp. p50(2008)]